MSDPSALPPLVKRLVTHHGARLVERDSIAAFEATPGPACLFFAGDPVRFPEGLDVAVVLPELRAAAGEPFAIAVAPREQEEELARRYGSQRWPSLVFLRDGHYLATVAGMKDWGEFVDAVRAALAAPPSRRPSVGIPVVAAAAAAGCA